MGHLRIMSGANIRKLNQLTEQEFISHIGTEYSPSTAKNRSLKSEIVNNDLPSLSEFSAALSQPLPLPPSAFDFADEPSGAEEQITRINRSLIVENTKYMVIFGLLIGIFVFLPITIMFWQVYVNL